MADFSGVSFSDGLHSVGIVQFAAQTFSDGAYSKGNFEVAGTQYSFSNSVYKTANVEISSRSYAIPVANYYRMMAYDTSASTWRTWLAAGEPDLSARQYNGVAFPFTEIFVVSKL